MVTFLLVTLSEVRPLAFLMMPTMLFTSNSICSSRRISTRYMSLYGATFRTWKAPTNWSLSNSLSMRRTARMIGKTCTPIDKIYMHQVTSRCHIE